MMFGNGYNGIGSCLEFGSGYGYGYGHIFGMIMMGTFIVLSIIAIIFILKRTNHHQPENEALELLKLRYVRGEISEEEYLSKKKLLS